MNKKHVYISCARKPGRCLVGIKKSGVLLAKATLTQKEAKQLRDDLLSMYPIGNSKER